MNITIFGSGYVGLVTGACLAEIGNDVLCVDTDQRKIDLLNSGGVPIYEPGLEELIAKNKAAGRIRFTSNVADGVRHGSVIFIAVGTPPAEDGSADLQYVLAVAQSIAENMTEFKILVDKSTVPVGTADQVKAKVADILLQREVTLPFTVVSNPEFLKEGAAIDDFMRPDRIVVGVSSDNTGQQAKTVMSQIYAPFNRNHERVIYMDVRSAELTKYAANAMLATRISFMNELANLADILGADIELVRRGIGSDTRIGFGFLYAGIGYGGSCFPKDVQALIRIAHEHHSPSKILEAVESANDAQKSVLLNKVFAKFGQNLEGYKFAIWGLSFKPNTDDMREAPSRIIIKRLLELGARIQVYDPIATTEAKLCFASDLSQEMYARISFEADMYQCLNGSDALLLLTEWKVFQAADMGKINKKLKTPVIFDGRNVYDPEVVKGYGIEYLGIGRS
jgi:UDPglucose 6-dehydrogenase